MTQSQQPLRIGLISGEFPPMQGGVGDFTRELARELVPLGHEVHILANAGCHAENLPDGCFVHPIVERWNWSLARRVSRWVKENGLDVLNLQYQAAAYDMHPAVNLLPGILSDAPLVVTFHDLKVPYLFPKAGPMRWQAVLALARRAAGVIVTNREDRQCLVPALGEQLLTVIPIGSNIAPVPPADYDRSAWRANLGVAPDETLLGYFGFLNESKGGEELFRTLYRLEQAGVPAKLLMIGGRTGSSDPANQAYALRLEQLIESLEVGERIVWTGYVTPEEVSAHLLATDCCLLPYRDGISFRRGSLMAALAHSRPIISTTPAVELPELVHGENVYLAPPLDPAALADAVIALRQDPVLAEKLASGAGRLAQAFRWDEIARQTGEFLERVVRS